VIKKITDDIIKSAMEGDQNAFETIYRNYFDFVANVAYRIVAKKDAAEEVCQEVFMTIYRKISTFRGESSLRTWVYRVTINCALQYTQKKSKEQKGRLELVEHIHKDTHTKDIRNKIDEQENEEIVQLLLNKLPHDQKICIILRSLEGLSYQEIADTLKIPINTVRSRIKRARESMMALRKEVIPHDL
jgi:RNA polymerase sigma-70 factor (ECF subfamily)